MESGFQTGLPPSSAGALGIAQFMPSTAASMGIDPNDPYQSLAAAAKLDAQNLAQFGGSYSAMLTAYLGGPGSVPSDGSTPSFATAYVNGILGGTNVTNNPPPADVSQFPNGPAAPGGSGGTFPSATSNSGTGSIDPNLAALLGLTGTTPTTNWTDPATGVTYTIPSSTAATVGYDYAALAQKTASDNAAAAHAAAQDAVAAGDLTLAQQKEADANYWHGVATQLSLGQQADTQEQTQSSYQTAMAKIQADAQTAAQQYQIGMMNATTAAEKEAVDQQWNQQQALIQQAAQALEGTKAQTAQFSAETTRATDLGNLALNEQKQIDTEASNPRNLMGLYFEQRGITPDWQTIVSGGAPASMPALVPSNPMTAYVPTTAAPTNFNPTFPIVSGNIPITTTPPPMPTVPNYSAAYPLSTPPTTTIPPFSSPSTTATGQPQPGGGIGTTPGAGTTAPGGGGYVAPNGTAQNPFIAPNTGPATPANNYSGVPANDPGLMGLKSGQWDLVTTGMAGPSLVSDYKGYNVALGGNQGSVLGQNYSIGPGTPIWLQKQAHGGYTDAPVIMTGDAPSANPSAGGALPEIVYNPQRAKLFVQPNPHVAMAMAGLGIMPRSKAPRYAFGTNLGGPMQPGATSTSAGGSGWLSQLTSDFGNLGMHFQPRQPAPMAHPTGHYNPYDGQQPQAAQSAPPSTAYDYGGFGSPYDQAYSPSAYPGIAGVLAGQGYSPPTTASPYQGVYSSPTTTVNPYQGVYSLPNFGNVSAPPSMGGPDFSPNTNYTSLPHVQPGMPLQRYALGTDNSAAYASAGMGGDWIQSAPNGGVPTGTMLPNNMQALANYGVPLPPALVAANTGQIAPTLNMGAAYGNAGGGVAPSLQTLNAETPGEQGLQQEYTQGVTGIPWDDFVKALSQPTADLNTAPKSTGRGF